MDLLEQLTADEALFFDGHVDVLPIYIYLREAILRHCQGTQIIVKKTQISFCNRHLFAAASFLPVRRANMRPASYLTVTFSLPQRLDCARVDASVQVSARRWTHHVLISQTDHIDAQLIAWLVQAAEFSCGGNRWDNEL